MKPSKQTPSLFQSSLYPKTIAALLRRRLDTRAFRSGDNVLLPSMTLFFFLFLSSSTSPSSFSATSSSLSRLFHPCTTEDRPFRDSRYAKSFAIRFLGIRKERRRRTLKYYNIYYKRILDDNSIHFFQYSELDILLSFKRRVFCNTNVRRIKDVADGKSICFHDYLRSRERKLRKFLVTSRA